MLEEDGRREAKTEKMTRWGLLRLQRARGVQIHLGVEFAMDGGSHLLKENYSISKQLSVASDSSTRHGTSAYPVPPFLKHFIYSLLT